MNSSAHVSRKAALVLLVACISTPANAAGIIESIVDAPVITTGRVSGRATEFVINLDTSMDPTVDGRSLAAGDTIKIYLPRSFVNTAGGPDYGFGQALATCFPAAGDCSTGVLLQGWPQRPIRPPVVKYVISFDPGDHAVVFTALEDLGPAGPAEPGIKQMHLILNTFVNPRPGRHDVVIDAMTGVGGAVETGIGTLHIIPKARPHLGVTSVFNTGAPNTIFQETGAGEPTSLAWDFLLWGRNADPLTGVVIVPISDSFWLLKQGNKAVGHISVEGPSGAMIEGGPSVPIAAPVTGVPTARLTLQFTAGPTAGTYVTTISVAGGTQVQMCVEAN